MTDLLDNIDLLTLPHHTRVIDDTGTYRGTRTDPPLLAQLRADITGGNSSTGSGARTQDHARNLINPEAHKLYTDIETRVRQWARRGGHDRHTNVWPAPEAVLRTWYSNAYGSNVDLTSYAATIETWITQINDLLDPPHRIDINAPCPRCHTIWTITNIDGHDQQVQALNGTDYPHPDHHRSYVTCRACNTTWQGIDGAEHLAAELATADDMADA